MAITQDAPNLAITAGEALAAHRLVKPDGTYADLGTTRDYCGVTLEAIANGAVGTLRQPHAGTMKITVSEAVAQGDIAYKANDGKCSKTATSSVAVGVYMEAGSGDGSVVEMQPY